ncbi:DUF4167 domain-containing protein [Niveispirillum fermenti]|uniref:DUF4167 domain-containing protein n=1 Tax=Niveispirillum fermenti TaxID=1233113 RepID=UPI003A8AC1BA
MRQGPNQRRGRGRGGSGGNNGGGNNGNGGGNRRQNVPLRHQNYDSNGPDVRIRGNAFQVYEKYQALARDANASGDRIAAENYLQHAEHYYRIICQINEQEGRARQHVPRQDGNGFDGDDAEGGEDGGSEPVDAESDQPAA